jgi:hypothetical protein
MPDTALHAAALLLATKKRLIPKEEAIDYLAGDARITKMSYVLVNKKNGTIHRLLIQDVFKCLDREETRKEKTESSDIDARVREAFELAETEKRLRMQDFTNRLNQLNPLGGTFSLWGAIMSGSGGFMLAHAMQLQTESAIHQIYQILGIAGGLMLVGLGILVKQSNHQSVLLRSVVTLLDGTNRR